MQLHILAGEVTNCSEQPGAVKLMIRLPFEPLQGWFENTVSSLCGLLTEDAKTNLLLIKEGLHMASEDVDLPSWLDYLSASLEEVRDHCSRSLLELTEVVFVVGAQLSAKAALHNNFQTCQHLFDRLGLSWCTEQQEVKVFEEEI